ncbi:glycoside hydrolase family 30 protein [Chitinophaga sp. YIM B06452]|uniref:glycoside hydrolase family 30 protein n=1 Tax=Chitinophaga sp. YIM B06452 TaxID=3082158 RepID=UPI0031FE63E0
MKNILLSLCAALALQQAAAQPAPRKPVAIHIDPAVTYQAIHNFAASDAWACQFAGNWPDEKRNQMADWLFSTDTTATGAPRGIGLSMWRFNIGAGSAKQGDSSGIKDEWRRAASFLDEDAISRERQAGQLWFLEAAKKRGVPYFLAFLNSPPVQLTVNGKAFATKGNCNLSPGKYAALSDYVAEVIPVIQSRSGVMFDHFSPANEPQWDWSDGGQEGCPYNNDEISGLVKKLSETFTAKKLDAKILVAEAGKINYLYETHDKPGKGEQIKAFFSKGSPNYLGGLPNVRHSIAGHSYFTTSPASPAVAMRRQLAASVASVPGLDFWQSEYCILGDNGGEINGEGKDLGMKAALYLARVIHHDLTIANATAWQYWLAVSPYNYKDGLVYIDKNKTDGQVQDSKMLWVLGNYSRFIRPGAKRIQASADSAQGLLVSAYRNTDNSINIVIVNNDPAAVDITLNFSHAKPEQLRSYTTAEDSSLQPGRPHSNRKAVIPGRSVVTLVGKM